MILPSLSISLVVTVAFLCICFPHQFDAICAQDAGPTGSQIVPEVLQQRLRITWGKINWPHGLNDVRLEN